MSHLKEYGVKHIFMLSGGGMMYLMDSLGRSGIEYICCHHEQAAGIAAVGYALENNGLGVCMVTTGPGGTNALTACGAAYVDSTPVLFISGQVKTDDFASIRHVRQYGAQENDIVSMAAPVTKYAVTVTDATDIGYHLDKALYLATHGRRGPVWIDIPLDIQNAEIEPGMLRVFAPEESEDRDIYIQKGHGIGDIEGLADRLVSDIKDAERPLFVVGHGLKASDSEDIFRIIARRSGIPVMTTWRELALLDDEDELFYGSPGLQARRYSNLILQGADLVVVLGSRLDNMITAFNEEHFGFRAKKYIVDIDENELNKYKIPDLTTINCDVGVFLSILDRLTDNIRITDRREKWIDICRQIRNRYPLSEEKQSREMKGVDLYKLAGKVSDCCTRDDVVVISSTSRCNTAGHIAFRHKAGQRLISSMGFGSMGFALPQVVGAWFASEIPADRRRVIMIEGDGSLQLNIQELQTIVHHGINAKIFIFSNVGYAAIATMQDRNFNGRHVGSDADSGVTLPQLHRIADAYGIGYRLIEDDDRIEDTVKEVMCTSGPVICEFRGDIEYDEIPKCISSLNDKGQRVSATLENPYPFMDETELDEIYEVILQ